VAEQLNIIRDELLNLFDNAPCGYHSLDAHGYFVNINKTLLGWLGYQKSEVVGKLKFIDLVTEEDQATMEAVSKLLKGKSSEKKIKLNLIKKSGEKFPVVLGVVERQGKQDPAKMILYMIDNSESKEAVERMKKLDQELEAFSYSISHDLRAPLRSIDGYSRILQEDYGGKLDEEGRRVLNVIMNNAKRMGNLIDDLLDFGRLGRKPMLLSQVSMTDMVNSIVKEILVHEGNRKIGVKVGELHPAYADVDMIRRVWFNLLDNAVKYTGKKESAVIEVRSYETGAGEVCYEVKDNGDGFDMKYAPKLFGVFQRLHKIQDFPGTGVGLAIVKRIISRHGGRVWAEGKLHESAIFYFTIPIENENNEYS